MKKFCTLAVILALTGTGFLFVEGCKPKAPSVGGGGKTSSAEKTSFKEVTSKLDDGGSFYLYLSTEQWLNNLSGKIGNLHQLVSSLPDAQDKREDIDKAFNIGTQLVKDSGLEEISGIGMSSIAREPGFYHNKLIVHHYSGQGNGFMWTIFGKEPHELNGLDLLPTNTAMAAFYDLDAAQVWAVIEKECEQSGFPEAKNSLDKFRREFAQNAQMKWEDAVGSLAGEFGIVVTLDPSRMITIPLPTQQPLDIPEPGFMLVIKVKNDAIFNRIDAALAKSGQQVIRVDKDGVKMRTVSVPVPIVTLRPSVATSGGYLFIATTDGLIQEALAVKGGKPGLKSTDEFKRLADGLPQQGNQFCFLSQRFGQTIRKVQQQALEMHQQASPQVNELLKSFLDPDRATFAFAVGANTDEGWMTVANGNQNSGTIVAASAAVVPGMLAAIAVPNFVKARDTAQKNTCINNLRQIDGAKQQWALEKNKKETDTPTWEDLQPYLGRSKASLHCPNGGQYTIGAMSQQPTCTVAGHVLP